MKSLWLAAILLLAACDQDKLPDDLSQSEGQASVEEVNFAEEEPGNAALPPVAGDTANEELAAAMPDELAEGADAADPLAPADSDPSFDCSAATARVEKHICDVPELGAIDRRVAEAFDRAMDEASGDEGERLRHLGRQYLADRNRCRDDYCIKQAYRWYERDIYTLMGWRGPN